MSVLTRLRDAYAAWSLRMGGLVLLMYGAAGAMVGIEVIALVIAWPVAIGLGVVMLVGGGAVTRRLLRQPDARPGRDG